MSELPKDLEPTADNNDVLRALRDNDEVDYRIDPTMMMENLRITPAERLKQATQIARQWDAILSYVRRNRP